MIIIRKTRGYQMSLPEEDIKVICLHEILKQTTNSFANLNLGSYPYSTSNPELVISFLTEHYQILADPYSTAQDNIVQALASVLNHTDSLKIIKFNKVLFSNILKAFQQNLNYNIILDCTVFKTPNNYLNPNPKSLTTYFLIIQTKPITSEATIIKNFSQINRKLPNIKILSLKPPFCEY